MASLHAFELLRSFVDATWPDAAPAPCPLNWDNEAFALPQPFDAQDQPQCWGRVLVNGDLWEQQSIGAGDPAAERWGETGSLLLTVFAPVNAGSQPVRAQLTAFAEMCRGQDLGGQLELQDVHFDPIGTKDESGAWWGMTITIDWFRS
ncbi:hypothetical protein J2847_006420 [Azospirillum agricola]|uniref:hypothetical protein n=1 Tax=Azospirillum agricola TaxID=1720247 RepID=UPI001AE79397|nr:hypothetical protein [Azospirillum agricola]MBP2233085.1 hypothetical protein [Azospirillum agricola]